MHLFGFIIRIYHDAARSSECQVREVHVPEELTEDAISLFSNMTYVIGYRNNNAKLSLLSSLKHEYEFISSALVRISIHRLWSNMWYKQISTERSNVSGMFTVRFYKYLFLWGISTNTLYAFLSTAPFLYMIFLTMASRTYHATPHYTIFSSFSKRRALL